MTDLLSALIALSILAMTAVYVKTRFQAIENRLWRFGRDGVGMQDFALRFNGARIIDSLTSQDNGTTNISRTNPSWVALDDDLRPGMCWPIQNVSGQIGVKLSASVMISHVTIDHIPKELSFNITNAPRHIRVWGITERRTGRPPQQHPMPPLNTPNFAYDSIAVFHYDIHSTEYSQTFPIMLTEDLFDGVVVEILNNWGGEKTCIYRVRVHGKRSEGSAGL